MVNTALSLISSGVVWLAFLIGVVVIGGGLIAAARAHGRRVWEREQADREAIETMERIRAAQRSPARSEPPRPAPVFAVDRPHAD